MPRGAFIDRQSVLQYLIASRSKIDNGLSTKDLTDYHRLITWFHGSGGMAARENEFQRHFSYFYRLGVAGLTPEFMTKYFSLMAALPRNTQVDLVAICSELQPFRDRQGRETLQFSFCTKLAATLNPNYPIYDANVAKVFQFSPPAPSMPYDDRVRQYLAFYSHLQSTIEWISASPRIHKLVPKSLQEMEEWKTLSTTKQVDFLCWAAGKP
jgi:hypothetical protein